MTMIHCGYSRLLIMYIDTYEQYFMYIHHFFTRDTRSRFLQTIGTVQRAKQIANNGYKLKWLMDIHFNKISYNNNCNRSLYVKYAFEIDSI